MTEETLLHQTRHLEELLSRSQKDFESLKSYVTQSIDLLETRSSDPFTLAWIRKIRDRLISGETHACG